MTTASARTLSLTFTLLLPACASPVSGTVQQSTLIEDVTLISPERDGPMLGVDVLIRDGRIAAIGTNLRAGARVLRVDGRGRYLIPGLIDSHVHIGHSMSFDDAAVVLQPELMASYRAHLPRAYLAFGFTTLVDLDLRPDDRSWFEATPLHPRLFHCGRGVRIPAGYGALRIPPDAEARDFSHLVHEPAQASRWPRALDPKDYTPARAVERVVNAGGICVKVFIESGFGVFDWPVPRPETLVALRAEASGRGLTFVAHATSAELGAQQSMWDRM